MGSLFPFPHQGLLVGPQATVKGNTVYAEVEPAYSRWLPWPGRTSRWWYEVHAVYPEADEHGINRSTFAYIQPGSGGAFTLASCVRRAQRAIEHFAEEYDISEQRDHTALREVAFVVFVVVCFALIAIPWELVFRV